ncbi:16S rRNA (cytosine(1402)-N(4))-methyltransferase RsmH [Gammaproteobacteria bacterium]|nr:16S rRNA (cytosine(1402)-N(4))-methyltransferase RsmH [Gammaproteobacteria bacterium]
MKHTPILLEESVKSLISNTNGLYLDCTFGRGGHTKKILEKLSSEGQLISFDLDDAAMEVAKNIDHKNFKFIKTNFSQIDDYVEDDSLSGVLIDCGVSSPQLDEPERGFSFQTKGPLDMRFNQKQKLTCKDIIENFSEKQIATILWKYGEEKESRRIAKLIVKKREQNAIENTLILAEIIKTAKTIKTKKHPATKSFQALRMAVNSEFENLKTCLDRIKDKLTKSGKLVIISFHSLEDRIAKQTFKPKINFHEKNLPLIHEDVSDKFKISKIIYPSQEEISMNPRARSAKMRIIEKL